MAVNNPSAVSAVVGGNLITAYDFLNKPNVSSVLWKRYGKQWISFMQLMEACGFTEKVENNNVYVWDEDVIHPGFKSRNNVADPGAGNPILITLAALSVDASNRFYPQFRDQVRINGVNGIITVVDRTVPAQPVLTIQPHQTTQTFGAVVAGQTIGIYSRAKGEGTGQGESRFSKIIGEQFYLKKTDQTLIITGDQLINQSYLEKLSDGTAIPYKNFALKGKSDELYRIMLTLGGAMLFDDPITNTNAIAEPGLQNMKGLVPWIEAGGNVGSYLNYGLSDVKFMTRVLEAKGAGQNFAILAAFDLFQNIEDTIGNTLAANPMCFVQDASKKGVAQTFGVDNIQVDGQSVNYGVKSFTSGTRTFQLTKLAELSNPNIYNNQYTTDGGLGIVVPLDNTVAADGKSTVSHMGIIYPTYADGSTRKMETWYRGSASPQSGYNTNDDNLEIQIRAHMGSIYRGQEHFYLIKKQ